MPKPEDTPLMQQWREAKQRHPDALIFFRVGDFYEMFNEDAVEGARLLGLTLTSRNNGGAADVPLAGVPVRARDDYLERLVRMGRRVAVCEQVEDPALARGLVRREVIETITPGAVLAEALLAERRNNWLVALCDDGVDHALAAADISTGEVLLRRVARGGLAAELGTLGPSEVLLPAGANAVPDTAGAVSTVRPDWWFAAETGEEEIRRAYRIHDLRGFGFESEDGALAGVLGALLAYLTEVQPVAVAALRPPQIRRQGDAMVLDEMTRRNLELVETLRADHQSGRPATLLDVVDETLTPMGSRLLREWLLRPLVEAQRIWERQEAVAELHADAGMRRSVRAALGTVRDLERLAARVAAARAAPRDVSGLARSLAALPAVKDALRIASSPLLQRLKSMDALESLCEMTLRAIADAPPMSVAEGGVIREGFDAELDELRAVRDGAQDTIARLQQQERERTGIGSLKVGYNKIFGYYIEVTRPHLGRVPTDYQRRQTVSNAERFVTSELKEWENRIASAEERILEREAQLFAEVRAAVGAETRTLQQTAQQVATVDVLATLAQVAERRGYARPEIHTGYRLEIQGGRHPVVETMMAREAFIPNDVVLDEDRRIIILTGPNMAGKSTLLRQVGLIQLLGQMGAFVPAARARLPICDRIFTRVGASDNLVRGQSTFMVEMQETSAILHGATEASLVLLDEIGRGTATYDGVSIAWAVTEFLHESPGAKTVFATHYHELTQLADLMPAIINCNVAVREVGQDIVFLHQLQSGGADRSYGIDVGRLAGLPAHVVERAREILRDLEGAHGGPLGRAGRNRPRSAQVPGQLSLFQAPDHPALRRLRALNIDGLTPLEALNQLAELTKLARDESG